MDCPKKNDIGFAWTPNVCKIIASWASFRGFEAFYIVLEVQVE